MPRYDVRCDVCGKVEELIIRIADFDRRPMCCGQMTNVKIAPVNFNADTKVLYKSMLTGEMVTSGRRHRQLLREHNCIEVGNENIESKKVDFALDKKEMHELKTELSHRIEAARL